MVNVVAVPFGCGCCMTKVADLRISGIRVGAMRRSRCCCRLVGGRSCVGVGVGCGRRVGCVGAVVGPLLYKVEHFLYRVGFPASPRSVVGNMEQLSSGVAVVVVERYQVASNMFPRSVGEHRSACKARYI